MLGLKLHHDKHASFHPIEESFISIHEIIFSSINHIIL